MPGPLLVFTAVDKTRGGRQDLFRQRSPGAHPRRGSDQEEAAVRGSREGGSSKRHTTGGGEGPGDKSGGFNSQPSQAPLTN